MVAGIIRILFLALLCCCAGVAQEISRAAREMFNVAVREFTAEQYGPAAESFQKVIEMAPNLFQARVYLATSYVQLFVPGSNSAENRDVARRAITALDEVLRRDPKNLPATDSLASLYLQMRDLPRANEWVRRVLILSPDNKGALSTLGLLALLEFTDKDREARLTLEMKPGDPGPLPDDELRAELKAQFWDKLQAGIGFAKQAISVDPNYADAMAAIAQLTRVRADLADSEEQYHSMIAEADQWSQRAASATGAAQKP